MAQATQPSELVPQYVSKGFHMRPLPFRLSQASILVVDDVPFNLKLISNALTKAGFTSIKTAANGEEAVEKTYDLKPDLILLDLHMPLLDGFGYCEHIRGEGALPRMPIIVQTIIGEREARLRALQCGADDFLNKPLDQDELVLRVRIHLERYFMQQDTDDMCNYLKLELREAQGIRDSMEGAAIDHSTLRKLGKHCETLEAITRVPTFARDNVSL